VYFQATWPYRGLKKITKRMRKFAATSGGSRNFWWRCMTMSVYSIDAEPEKTKKSCDD